jgi:hypothetical protein
MQVLLAQVFLCTSFLAEAATLPAPFPATFEHNAGQADSSVKFLSRNSGAPIYLTSAGVHLATSSGPVSFEFVGANPHAEIVGLDRQRVQTNYFTGRDPSRWRTGVPNYKSVRYREIYPGVDAVFYRKDGELEFDLVVQPGADPNLVRFAVKGRGEIRLDRPGNLVVRLSEFVSMAGSSGERQYISI